MDLAAQKDFEEHIGLLRRSALAINRVLFKVLQHVGLQLFDLDSVHTAEGQPLLTFVVSKVAKPNECNACTDFVHPYLG